METDQDKYAAIASAQAEEIQERIETAVALAPARDPLKAVHLRRMKRGRDRWLALSIETNSEGVSLGISDVQLLAHLLLSTMGISDGQPAA